MKKLALVLVGCLLGTSVLADNGLSLELMAGSATQRLEATPGTGNISGDDSSYGARFGWQFYKHIALEASYHNFGKAKETGFGNIETTAINAGLRFILPFENGFSFSARAGASQWDSDAELVSTTTPGSTIFVDDDGTDYYFGASLRFDFDNFFVSGDYLVLDGDIELLGTDHEHKTKDFSFAIGKKF